MLHLGDMYMHNQVTITIEQQSLNIARNINEYEKFLMIYICIRNTESKKKK